MKASDNQRIMAFVDDMSFPTDYVPLTSHFESDFKSRKARHDKYGKTGIDPDKIDNDIVLPTGSPLTYRDIFDEVKNREVEKDQKDNYIKYKEDKDG